MYKVDLSAKAREFFRKTDRPLARKLARCFGQLEHDPRQHPNIKRLSGQLSEHFRYRIGDYRVVYRIDDGRQTVIVVRIAHRSEAYE